MKWLPLKNQAEPKTTKYETEEFLIEKIQACKREESYLSAWQMAWSRTPSRSLVDENGNLHKTDFCQRTSYKLQFQGRDRCDERSAYH